MILISTRPLLLVATSDNEESDFDFVPFVIGSELLILL